MHKVLGALLFTDPCHHSVHQKTCMYLSAGVWLLCGLASDC